MTRNIRLLLFIFLTATGLVRAQDSPKKWSFYNGIGAGYGEKRLIATDHLNVAYKKITVGVFARWSCRKDWRDVNVNPQYAYDEYKFVNEFAALGGWRFGDTEQNLFVVMGGPMFRNENARMWPDKGSGMAPLIGTMLDDVNSDDVKSYGGIVTLEWIHTNPQKNVGIGILGFYSFVPHHQSAGISVNFVFGRILSGPWSPTE